MKPIDELVKLLMGLPLGHYVCKREVEREDYSAKRTLRWETFVFYKSKDETYPYQIIGSDNIYDETRLLMNCYGEYSPLIDIKPL